jgi:carboxypeptidase Taq
VTDHILQLRQRLAGLADLKSTAHLLGWDQQTMMPPRGADARADALATLQGISHDLFVSPEVGHLLDAADSALDGSDPDSDDVRLVRVTRRLWEKARRVPGELAADLVRAGSIGQDVWVRARKDSDFSMLVPYLARNFELARRYVDCFDSYDRAYDVVLDDYEPGMRSADVDVLFAELKAQLTSCIASVSEHRDKVDGSCLHHEVAVDKQRALVDEVVAMMGFDRDGWRMDDAVHPFATGVANADVRITTRWDPHYFPMGLYGAMHECGHGLYEAGIADSLQRSPLGHAESLGLHESQSRMWENVVGRGRAFCGVLAPRAARCFGGPFADLEVEALYRAVNRVEPSLIRVEADEVTYGLHIVLRYELEQELIDGRLAVSDLPEAWNARFEQYFGLDVPDDAHGVLQDVHWSAGLIGYFPTYVLGNLIASQLWTRVHADMPDLDARIGAGDLQPLREWLREHVHRHGAKFSTRELLQRVVGGPIVVEPFIDYLRTKLSEVYGIDLGAATPPDEEGGAQIASNDLSSELSGR